MSAQKKFGIIGIRIRKGDVVFHVHNELAGNEGVWLAKGQVHGLWDAPVKTTYKTGAFQEGSRQRARKWLHRDLSLGFHIRDTATVYELNDSLFRQIFDYEEDLWDLNPEPTTIEVETTLSGVRKLDVLMYEQPDFDPDLDPSMQQYGNLIMKLRAPQPFWYSDDDISTFSSPSETATGYVTVSNPTDLVAYQKFILTRATWTLPDQQWIGPKGERVPGGPNAARAITGIEVTYANGGAVVDLDRQELMFRDANDTNILGQLAGRFFNYAIPPYTPPTELPVSYEDAPEIGAMVRLVTPRRWTRPWGLELPATGEEHRNPPTFTTFRNVGTFTYTLPDDCDAVDIVVRGGGGGGGGGRLFPGEAGKAGEWAAITLVRGVDIPWDTRTFSGVVGAGGKGGAPGMPAAGSGEPTSVTAVLSAAGGAGAAWVGHSDGQGGSNLVFNGRTYPAGRGVPVQADGIAPGGGAGGGWPFCWGGTGAPGQAWFYAYRTEAAGS